MSDQHQSDAEKKARRAELRASRAAVRQRIIDRLADEGRSDLAARLEVCGQEVRLKCTTCGVARVAFKRCDNKWCPACAPALAHRVVERIAPLASMMKFPLFVTWTAKNWTDRVGLREFRRAFAKLIKLRWFKRIVPGGCAAFEVSRLTEKDRRRLKLGPRDGLGFHPHAHSLLDCKWLGITQRRPAPGCPKTAWNRAVRIALDEVAAQWSLALGRPGSVKVRAVFIRGDQDMMTAMKEVVKYSVDMDVLEKSDEPIAPLIDELKLTRNLTTFGSWYRHPALKKRPKTSLPCECCGDEKTFLPAGMVDAWAEKMGKVATRKTPYFGPQ